MDDQSGDDDDEEEEEKKRYKTEIGRWVKKKGITSSLIVHERKKEIGF